MNDSRYMRPPVTPAADVFTLNEAAGPFGKPTGIGDANVYPFAAIVAQIAKGKPDVDEAEELWQFICTFSGPTTPLIEDVSVIVWTLNHFSGLWSGTAPIRFVGDSLILTEGVGQAFHMPGILGTTHVGLQISGQGVNNDLHWLHSWS